MKFNPCIDKCTHADTHCLGCNRSHEEIAKTKKLVEALVHFAKEKNYDNIEEFSQVIGENILKKLKSS